MVYLCSFVSLDSNDILFSVGNKYCLLHLIRVDWLSPLLLLLSLCRMISDEYVLFCWINSHRKYLITECHCRFKGNTFREFGALNGKRIESQHEKVEEKKKKHTLEAAVYLLNAIKRKKSRTAK